MIVKAIIFPSSATSPSLYLDTYMYFRQHDVNGWLEKQKQRRRRAGMNAPTNHRHHCAALVPPPWFRRAGAAALVLLCWCWFAGVATAVAAAVCVVAWVKRLMHLASAPRLAAPQGLPCLVCQPACLLGCLSGLSHVASLIEGPPMPETSFFVSWSASQPCVENAVPEPLASLCNAIVGRDTGSTYKKICSSLYYVAKFEYTCFFDRYVNGFF